jgi:murein L,D-transpeptidase YafK
MRRIFIFCAFLLSLLSIILLLAYPYFGDYLPGKVDIQKVRERILPSLKAQLESNGSKLGDPLFIRIFKQTKKLEIWINHENAFSLFKSYPICMFSGDLGPKQKEGDKQSPEGFYSVTLSQLNPNSNYHLAFNVGFPNAYDRAKGYTGSFLMVHGSCVSVGCYAMGNSQIEEIYLMIEAALQYGQPYVALHIFPFEMTAENMKKYAASDWHLFWEQLKSGYSYFENNHIVPDILVKDGKYTVVMPVNP